MATHVVINPDLLTFTTLEQAFLDIAGEPAATEVTYTVYPIGAPSKTVKVAMDGKNFVASPDLFGLSAKKAALVVAVTSDPSTPSVAVLRQQLGAVRVAITIPSSNLTMGTSFNLPISDLFGGGTLFIGNPGATAATVVTQYGSSQAAPDAHVTVPPLSLVTVKITQGAANLLLTSTNGVPVVAQAAIGTRFQALFPIGPAV
jgi:hypothetical protein